MRGKKRKKTCTKPRKKREKFIKYSNKKGNVYRKQKETKN